MVEMVGQHGFKQRFPLVNLPDGAAQAVDDGVLDEIALRAGSGRFFDIHCILMDGEHEHFGGGRRLAYANKSNRGAT